MQVEENVRMMVWYVYIVLGGKDVRGMFKDAQQCGIVKDVEG